MRTQAPPQQLGQHPWNTVVYYVVMIAVCYVWNRMNVSFLPFAIQTLTPKLPGKRL